MENVLVVLKNRYRRLHNTLRSILNERTNLIMSSSVELLNFKPDYLENQVYIDKELPVLESKIQEIQNELSVISDKILKHTGQNSVYVNEINLFVNSGNFTITETIPAKDRSLFLSLVREELVYLYEHCVDKHDTTLRNIYMKSLLPDGNKAAEIDHIYSWYCDIYTHLTKDVTTEQEATMEKIIKYGYLLTMVRNMTL
jgi:hypothetical protein